MGVIEAFIELILYACFGTYICMGLGFCVMGGIYMGEVGEVSNTGLYLCFAGLTMLVVGGVAVYSTLKKIWLLLWIVELINLALFVILYIIIMVALLLALGVSDPVRRGTEESWTKSRKALEDQQFCQKQAGPICTAFYKDTSLASKTDKCPIDTTTTPSLYEARTNCTKLDELKLSSTDMKHCHAFASACFGCDTECMNAAIEKVKDNIVPAAITTLCVCFYSLIVLVINVSIIEADEVSPGKQKLGAVTNSLLGLTSFIMFVIGIVGYLDAKDNCVGDDCTSWAPIGIICLGLFIFGTAVLAVFGILKDIKLFIRVADLLLVIFVLILLLAGLLLGMSSGTLMDDLDERYTTSYPSLRASIEAYDASYCQLKPEDCWAITNSASKTGHGIKPCDGDADVCIVHDRDDLWTAQYNALQSLDFTKAENSDFKNKCKTTPVCIFCKKMWNDLLATPTKKASAPVNYLTEVLVGCGWVTDHTGSDTPTAVTGAKDAESCAAAAKKNTGAVAASWDGSACKSYAKTEKKIKDDTQYTDLASCTNTTSTAVWTKKIHNHTYASSRSKASVAYCEIELKDFAGNAKCTGDCKKCEGVDFQNDRPKDMSKTQSCADWLVKYSLNECGMESECKTLLKTKTNFDKALKALTNSFCQFPDVSCKAKIMDKTQDEMQVIATIGIIFLCFFVVIIFFTRQGVRIFKDVGGGESEMADDGDDGDGEEVED